MGRPSRSGSASASRPPVHTDPNVSSRPLPARHHRLASVSSRTSIYGQDARRCGAVASCRDIARRCAAPPLPAETSCGGRLRQRDLDQARVAIGMLASRVKRVVSRADSSFDHRVGDAQSPKPVFVSRSLQETPPAPRLDGSQRERGECISRRTRAPLPAAPGAQETRGRRHGDKVMDARRTSTPRRHIHMRVDDLNPTRPRGFILDGARPDVSGVLHSRSRDGARQHDGYVLSNSPCPFS